MTTTAAIVDRAIKHQAKLNCCPADVRCMLDDNACASYSAPNSYWNALDQISAEIDRQKATHSSRYKPAPKRRWWKQWGWP